MAAYEKRRFKYIEEEKPRECHVVPDEHNENALEQKRQEKKASHERDDQKDTQSLPEVAEARAADAPHELRSEPDFPTRDDEHRLIYSAARHDRELNEKVRQYSALHPWESIRDSHQELEPDRIEDEREDRQLAEDERALDSALVKSNRNPEADLVAEEQRHHQMVKSDRIEEERVKEERKISEIKHDDPADKSERDSELDLNAHGSTPKRQVKADRIERERIDKERVSTEVEPLFKHPEQDVGIDLAPPKGEHDDRLRNEPVLEPEVDQDVYDLIDQTKDVEPWQSVHEMNVLAPKDIEHEEQDRIDLIALADARRQCDEQAPQDDERLDLSRYGEPNTNSENEQLENRSEPAAEPVQCILPVGVAVELPELGPLEPETLKYLHDQYRFLDNYVSVEQAQNHRGFSDDCKRSENDLESMRDEICPERQIRAQAQIEHLESVREDARVSEVDEYVAVNFVTNEKDACYQLNDAVTAKWTDLELSPAVQKIIDERSAPTIFIEQEKEKSELAFEERSMGPPLQQEAEVIHRQRIIWFDQEKVERDEDGLDRAIEDEPEPGYFMTVMITIGCGFYDVCVLERWNAYTYEEFMNHDPEAEPSPEAIEYIIQVEKRWRAWHDRVHHQTAELKQSRSRQARRDEIAYDDFDR